MPETWVKFLVSLQFLTAVEPSLKYKSLEIINIRIESKTFVALHLIRLKEFIFQRIIFWF